MGSWRQLQDHSAPEGKQQRAQGGRETSAVPATATGQHTDHSCMVSQLLRCRCLGLNDSLLCGCPVHPRVLSGSSRHYP